MSKSESPPESTSEPSRLTAIGEACALALVGAVVGALPTAIRASSEAGFLDGMVVGVAMLLLLLVPTALLVRRAARGFRGVVGRAPSGLLGLGLAMWAGLSVALLLILAAVLKAKTHHRGLGGATFGVFGAAMVVGAAVFVGRLVAIGRGLLERGVPRAILLGLAGLLCVGPLVALVVPMLSGDEAGGVRAALFDTLLLLAVGGVLLSRRLPEAMLPVARLGALPVSACLVVVGLVRVETSEIGDQVQRAGGLPATMLAGLEMWTDHDGDGVGAHFGGSDCDEGDPARYPGAEDPEGDGWDADCDGADGPVTLAAVAPEPPTRVAAAPRVAPKPAGTASSTAATVAAKAPASPDPEPVAKRSDVILVTLDTVRADHTTVYGYDTDTTPALKKLAERGVVFERAYAVGAGTQRALTPVVSGKSYARTPHSTKEWPLLREEAELLPEHLKKAGYQTGAVTSFTWLRKDRGFGQGFDHFIEDPWSTRHPEREYTSDLAADAAIALYEKLSADEAPIFLWVHVFDAHAKYVEHADHDFGDSAKERYDGEIAFQDAQLARLFEKVSSSPRADRTAWVVHGTHGEAFGEHDKLGHRRIIFDEVLRVPFFVVAPGVEAGRWDRDAVSIMDVAPTVLELADVKAAGLEGVSLVPALRSEDEFERSPVLSGAYQRMAVVDWPLKLHVRRRKDKRDRTILFDLGEDPKEMKDLSADRKDDLVRLHELAKKLSRVEDDEG